MNRATPFILGGMDDSIAFIGGGNMATAILAGLVGAGWPPGSLIVVETDPAQRTRLQTELGVRMLAAADQELADAGTVVWAVKPQSFKDAAAACASFVGQALQLSVMAGIRSDTVALATGSARVVRAMPNTPALVGQGMTGLYARPEVNSQERSSVERLLAPTGQTLWVGDDEAALDTVTALSGSGPAYVFYFLEAMQRAAVEMGMKADTGRRLAIATFAGATALAQTSPDPLSALRARVTSKGGTTHAAITRLEANGVADAFIAAMHAAQRRAMELGDEFGAG